MISAKAAGVYPMLAMGLMYAVGITGIGFAGALPDWLSLALLPAGEPEAVAFTVELAAPPGAAAGGLPGGFNR